MTDKRVSAQEFNRMSLKASEASSRRTRRLEASPVYSREFNISSFLMIPKLRGLWTFSSVDENGNLPDYSDQGRLMTNVNNVPFGVYELAPYADFSPSFSHYFYRNDEVGLSITGELTVGAWIWLDTAASGFYTILSKANHLTNKRCYDLYIQGDGSNASAIFEVSSNGTNSFTVTNPRSVSLSQWHFIVARFSPLTTMDIFLDNYPRLNPFGIPSSIYDADTPLVIGATPRSPFDFFMDGRIGISFISASYLSDMILSFLYKNSKPLFKLRAFSTDFLIELEDDSGDWIFEDDSGMMFG